TLRASTRLAQINRCQNSSNFNMIWKNPGVFPGVFDCEGFTSVVAHRPICSICRALCKMESWSTTSGALCSALLLPQTRYESTKHLPAHPTHGSKRAHRALVICQREALQKPGPTW